MKKMSVSASPCLTSSAITRCPRPAETRRTMPSPPNPPVTTLMEEFSVARSSCRRPWKREDTKTRKNCQKRVSPDPKHQGQCPNRRNELSHEALQLPLHVPVGEHTPVPRYHLKRSARGVQACCQPDGLRQACGSAVPLLLRAGLDPRGERAVVPSHAQELGPGRLRASDE